MAIWYTDNITGNDTTGNGTTTTPYKTINKAVSVAASDDTIRVAGSGWTLLSGTVSATGTSTPTINTSANLTSELTAGVSLVSLKDPQLGNRKLIFKVTAVTTTSFTVHTPMGLTPGISYEIEKITTNHYASATSNTTFENLSATGTNLTGIKIEAGWTGGFTAQDGITVMTYTITTTATSGTGFSMALGQTGWLVNNIVFSALATGINSGTNVGLGSIWATNSRVFGVNGTSSPLNIAGIPIKLYITTSPATILGGISPIIPFTINELYTIDSGSSSFAISLANKTSCTIENMYVKSTTSTTFGSSGGGQLYAGDWIVNNLTIAWATDSTNQAYVLFGDNSAGKLINLTSLGNEIFKFFGLAVPGTSQAQWINTSINIDNINVLGTNSISSGIKAVVTSNFVKDIEGEKLLIAGTNPIFADSTVFDTGTNSLRIKKSRTTIAIPIKQHFIPVGATAPITFTIRAKSVGNNVTQFAFQPTPGSGQEISLSVPYVLSQSKSLTNTWADYTYTLAAPDVIQMAGNYVMLSCVTQSAWAENYVWIDSVTVA